MMQVLFPNDPLEPQRVEPDFAIERAAAEAAGFATSLIDFELLTRGDVGAAVRRVSSDHASALYRGWMLTPARYEAFYQALQARGVSLTTSPAAYRTAHYLPDSYRWIEGHTAKSVWCEVKGEVDFARVHELIAPFGDGPLIVKDYVKSQKHYWREACFIPRASDRSAVERVVRRFLELQGPELAEGLVFRAFLPLKIAGTHPKSGMPLGAEVRIFWCEAEPMLEHRYWADLTPQDFEVPLAELRPIAAAVPSRFFTMDVALLEGGGWTVVELGDGQVAGLPSPELAQPFYKALRHDAWVRVTIQRFTDPSNPGWVELTLVDAAGVTHVFEEKVPIVSAENLGPESQYPRAELMACRVVGTRRSEDGRQLVTVDTDQPSGIESKTGQTQFEVLREHVRSLALAAESEG
jgi:hypothetical protein